MRVPESTALCRLLSLAVEIIAALQEACVLSEARVLLVSAVKGEWMGIITKQFWAGEVDNEKCCCHSLCMLLSRIKLMIQHPECPLHRRWQLFVLWFFLDIGSTALSQVLPRFPLRQESVPAKNPSVTRPRVTRPQGTGIFSRHPLIGDRLPP